METAQNQSGRIEVIDVLRGFTLLGIALVHFTEQYYAGMPPSSHESFTGNSISDQVVSILVGFFVSGKFFMIFSFLFGLSFFLQSGKAQNGAAFMIRFAWRLVILFGIGFVHHLHYRGDILTIYAVLGFFLLLCYRLPDRILLILALLLVADVPAIITRTFQVFDETSAQPFFMNQDQSSLQQYWDTVKTGAYANMLKANAAEHSIKMAFQVESGRLYITAGLFLLGLYAGRKGFLQPTSYFKRLIKISLYILLACVLIMLSVFGGMKLAGYDPPLAVQWLIGGGLYDIFNAALATIYVSAIMILFEKPKWKERLMFFYEPGRMGLTTYLMQTTAGFFLFFSPGLQLLGEVGSALCAGIALVFFLAQARFSKFWLQRFYYGPVEWLWRSLTWLKVQRFRRTSDVI